MIKSFYPVKAFALPRNRPSGMTSEKKKQMRAEADELLDEKLKRKGLSSPMDEIAAEDSIMRKNVNLRMGKASFNLLDPKKFKTYAIENIKELILKQIDSSDADDFTISKSIDRLFACFANWELYSDEQIKGIVKATKYILETRFDYLVVTEQNVTILMNILKADELKMDLMLELVTILGSIISKRKLRVKYIACIPDIVEMLARAIYLLGVSESKSFLSDTLLPNICQAINNLWDSNDRHIYVPGESNDQELIKMLVLLSGGLLVLMSAKEKLSNDQVSSIIESFCEKCLDFDDLSLQRDLLSKASEIMAPSGLYNCDKLLALESSKALPKRWLKMLEKAAALINQQVNQLLKSRSDLNSEDAEENGPVKRFAVEWSNPKLHLSE